MSTDIDRYIDGVNGSKIKLCRATISDGVSCGKPATQGRDFCQFHGGKTLAGADSPIFKTGLWSQQRKRFSTVAPELLDKIEALRNDPELYSLRDDTASGKGHLGAAARRRWGQRQDGGRPTHQQELSHPFA